MRTSLLAFALVACASPSPPAAPPAATPAPLPSSSAPPSPPGRAHHVPPASASAAPVAPAVPVASSSSSSTASPPPPLAELARAQQLVASFEAALNNGASPGAEELSTRDCWSKECASLARQAKKKFKVKQEGSAEIRGLRGTASFDIWCDGSRLCDKVFLLLERDCAAAPRWRVADVTERKGAPSAWLASAPAACAP